MNCIYRLYMRLFLVTHGPVFDIAVLCYKQSGWIFSFVMHTYVCGMTQNSVWERLEKGFTVDVAALTSQRSDLSLLSRISIHRFSSRRDRAWLIYNKYCFIVNLVANVEHVTRTYLHK